MSTHIESIHIYPVKSLSGISLRKSFVTTRGLRYDRRFMLTDAADRFITQRTHPQLTQFAVSLVGDRIRIDHRDVGFIAFDASPSERITHRAVVWNDTVSVSSANADVDEFFSDALREPIRLVGMPDSSSRPVDPVYGSADDHVSFADGYPVLILGAASIRELNSRMETPVPMNRFRPNIVVEGGTAWDEDSWRVLHLGDVAMRLVKPCSRCIVIKTDQETGERSDEPMATLQTYRKAGSKVLVGMNAIPDGPGPSDAIQVGQPVWIDRKVD